MKDVEVIYQNRVIKAQEKTGKKTNACMANFAKTEGTTKHGPLMILGYPFFRQYYVRFSWKHNEDRPAVFLDHPQHHCSNAPPAKTTTSADAAAASSGSTSTGKAAASLL